MLPIDRDIQVRGVGDGGLHEAGRWLPNIFFLLESCQGNKNN